MAASFELSVVTPEREVVKTQAEMIIVRGTEGDLGVMAHHMPLVTGLRPTAMVVRRGGGTERYAVSGGFLEVRGDQVSVLARTVERPEEIDLERAERARQRAEQRLENPGADVDVKRAKDALDRANARLEVGRLKDTTV